MAIKFGDFFSGSEININNEKLEEVFSKTKDAAEIFGRKSAEHLEISRKKVECLDAKTKLSKLYEKFGKIQYEAMIGIESNSEEIEDIVNRITVLKDKIDLLSAEIEEAKAQFNDAVVNATKKTRDAFQREFDRKSNNEVTVDADEVGADS